MVNPNINDIFKCTNYVKMSLLADDCMMYLSGNNRDTIQTKIQLDYDAVIEWTFRNNLRLNHGKTKAIIFGSCNRPMSSNLENPKPSSLCSHDIGFVQHHLLFFVFFINFYLYWLGLGSLQFSWPSQF